MSHTSTAQTFLWNRTAFPIETDAVARGYLSESNHIDIYGGVASAGDIRLLTQRGGRTVYGYGKATDFYREVAEYLANLLNDLFDFSGEEISLEKEYHFSSDDYRSDVKVDGIVEVGRNRQHYLIINEDGTLHPESTGGITVSRSTENLINTVQERLNEVNAAIAYLQQGGITPEEQSLYSEFIAERDQLFARLNELKDRTNVTVLNVNEAILVKVGSIHVEAQSLSGSGRLRIPSDARIHIENRSPNYLRTNLMAISETGYLSFNGWQVKTVNDINTINARSGGRFNGNVEIHAETPMISVTNTYCAPDGWCPDIFVDRSIINRTGIVSIRSDYGSVAIGQQADIAADTNIKAGTLRWLFRRLQAYRRRCAGEMGRVHTSP